MMKTSGLPPTSSPTSDELEAGESAINPKVVPVRHYGRYLAALLALLVVAQVVAALVLNENIKWNVTGDYLFNDAVLHGLLVTLELTVIAMLASLVLAIVIAIMRMSPSRIMNTISWGYVYIFRGVPLLVLLILVGNLGLFFNQFTIGVPRTGIELYSAPMRDVMTPFVASAVGLTLSGSAYMSEIVRGGLLAVHPGQRAAAKALGLDGRKTLQHIVLPQALRVIIPPLGNEFVNLLKATSLVSVIAGGDLLTVTHSIGGVTYRVIELMMVATIWYLLAITVFSVFQYFVERKFAEQ